VAAQQTVRLEARVLHVRPTLLLLHWLHLPVWRQPERGVGGGRCRDVGHAVELGCDVLRGLAAAAIAGQRMLCAMDVHDLVEGAEDVGLQVPLVEGAGG